MKDFERKAKAQRVLQAANELNKGRINIEQDSRLEI
tara:strand:+ start:148 stop:255 length:108 start_codon:yes stop_codon:yes gene_type:complete